MSLIAAGLSLINIQDAVDACRSDQPKIHRVTLLEKTSEPNRSETKYYFILRTDDGKEFSLHVTRTWFFTQNIGDSFKHKLCQWQIDGLNEPKYSSYLKVSGLLFAASFLLLMLGLHDV
jgi:hypothetical protein